MTAPTEEVDRLLRMIPRHYLELDSVVHAGFVDIERIPVSSKINSSDLKFIEAEIMARKARMGSK